MNWKSAKINKWKHQTMNWCISSMSVYKSCVQAEYRRNGTKYGKKFKEIWYIDNFWWLPVIVTNSKWVRRLSIAAPFDELFGVRWIALERQFNRYNLSRSSSKIFDLILQRPCLAYSISLTIEPKMLCLHIFLHWCSMVYGTRMCSSLQC